MNRKLSAKLRAFAAELDRELYALDAEERARYVDLRDAAIAVASGRALPSVLRPPASPQDEPEPVHDLRLIRGDRAQAVGSWRAWRARDRIGAVPVSPGDREAARLEHEAGLWLRARGG